jgi:hypothetical protein
MSQVKRREWLDVTRLDFRHAYRSPLVEVLIALFLYISISTVYSWANGTLPSFTHGIGSGSADRVLFYTSIVTTFVISKALEQLWVMAIFTGPPLVAFATARAFEDNSLRAILSYPVKRWHLLLMRTIVPTIIMGTCVTFSVLLVVFLMIPAPWNIETCILLFGMFWLMLLMLNASTIFLAVLTRRMVVSAVVGCGAWFSLQLASTTTSTAPVILRCIGNPIVFIASYVFGEGSNEILPWLSGDTATISMVVGSLCLISVMIVLFLSLSMWLFKRAEV